MLSEYNAIQPVISWLVVVSDDDADEVIAQQSVQLISKKKVILC